MPNRPTSVLNECGSRDIWPVLAECLSWGYGASGVFGFGSPGVHDRFHQIKHSDYLREDFVREYWKPWVKDGTINEPRHSTKRTPVAWWRSVLATLPLQWLSIAFIVFALAAIGSRYSSIFPFGPSSDVLSVSDPTPPELLPNPAANPGFPSRELIADSSQRTLDDVFVVYRNNTQRDAKLLFYDCAMHHRGPGDSQFQRSYFLDWPAEKGKDGWIDRLPKDSNWFGIYVCDLRTRKTTLIAFKDLTSSRVWRVSITEENRQLKGEVTHD